MAFLQVSWHWLQGHQRLALMGVITFGIVLVLVAWATFSTNRQPAARPNKANVDMVSSTDASSSTSQSMAITVDVKGAIVHPGLYHLKENQRLADLIQLAGGLTDQADQRQINLAQKLTDGQAIYLISQGESPINTDLNAGSTPSNSTGTVNLNTASLEVLQQLDGVGAKKAEKIIAYRNSQHGFKKIEELKEVEGIGEKRFEKLKTKVSV
ncbi:ComEA family DNA-binding protein [Convivina intestini]|uniref:ComEA family DNA-binding protein n=1 Tax=Convivina intestini TaxID=1505726 RepID=UPI00200C397C|nr:ComEA family DNA-binding protein [Convivina intestini]CAH1850396.1 ComE operon protein 1 [Convivina intestini]